VVAGEGSFEKGEMGKVQAGTIIERDWKGQGYRKNKEGTG
jgi:hypothetical protein